MRLYTGVGDRGTTALFDGTTVPKDDPRVAVYGDVDELNATVGVARAAGLPDDLEAMVVAVQRDLFAVGARLADPRSRIAVRVTKARIGREDVERLEGWIDTVDGALPPLRSFILPGGSPCGAALHQARAVCRRAERRIVGLGVDAVEPELLRYVNRLSDLLFALARAVNHRSGTAEIEW
jgi:cob(I)alamin adenosyltransferase